MNDEEMVLVPRKPTRKMLRAAAKAMSPEKRPTQDWMSVSEKHAVRYNAMIEAYLDEVPDGDHAMTPASISEPKPATFHKWVWFWQVGHYKVRGWQVEDRTLFKAKVWRELGLDDYIYGDGKMLGLSAALTQPLFADGSVTRIPSNWWKNRF